jgi:hypothetical protein
MGKPELLELFGSAALTFQPKVRFRSLRSTRLPDPVRRDHQSNSAW